MSASPALALFQAVGVELEYMIVDREDLSVLPCSDRLLQSVAGSYESEIELGELAWSNEVVLHVVELKTNGPRASLAGLSSLLAHDVERINRLLWP
ncbi:MAG TPA: glutamate--cysteine ligase, partial [Thermoanaerobaculia bacterium]|nr:glutamate--cysteine ligase [Thermoanaerobaculia bacterium]